jgi:hypothetical protein
MCYLKNVSTLIVVVLSTLSFQGCGATPFQTPSKELASYCESIPGEEGWKKTYECEHYRPEKPELKEKMPGADVKMPGTGDSNVGGVNEIADSPPEGELVGIPRSELPTACSAKPGDVKSLAECCNAVSFLVEAPCVKKKCAENKPDKPWAKCVLKKEKYGVQCKDVADAAYNDCTNEQQRHNASTTPFTQPAPAPLKGQASGGGGIGGAGVPGGTSTAPPAEY